MAATSTPLAGSPSPTRNERRRPASVPAAALLKALPLFHALDAGTLARLAGASERLALKRGGYAFRRGDAPVGMYVVIYGEVRLLGRDRGGGERLVGVVQPGHSFGEPVMFLGRPALVDAQAASDALLLRLPVAAVDAEIERNPVFARRLETFAGFATSITMQAAPPCGPGAASWP